MAEFRSEKVVQYQKDYYQAHKEEIQAKRAERYKNDPVYRETIRRRAAERNKNLVKKPRKKNKLFNTFKIRVGERDVTVRMCTITQLAQALGREIQTIRLWERRGILPKALYRTSEGPSGNRLYTEFQLAMILKIYKETIQTEDSGAIYRLSKTEFPARVRKLWDDYPLGIDLNALDD